MVTNLDYINQTCTDLGGVGGHVTNLAGLNEICTLLGGTGGHFLNLSAYNEICTLQGVTANHNLNLNELNAIVNGSYVTNNDALVQLGATLNQPEVTTYLAGLTTPLSSGQVTKLNKLVKDLKTATGSALLSDAFDTFYDIAGETLESSLRNLAKNAHHSENVDNPTWTQFEGSTGDGIGKYIKTNYKALTNGVKFTQNSASHGIYVRKNIAESRAVCGAYKSGLVGSHILPKSGTGYSGSSLNSTQASYMTTPVGDPRGMWIVNRLDSAGYKVYQNNTLINERVIVSQAPEDFEEYILCWNAAGTAALFSAQQVAIRFRGRGFTEAELFAINNAIETYMNSVGTSAIINEMAVLALTGQSNAIGYYPDDSALPIEYEGEQDDIFIRFNPLTGAEFDKMNPAIKCGYDKIADPDDNTGWGAEQSASHELLSFNRDILVIKSGFDGGRISEWDAGKEPFTELVNGFIQALNKPHLSLIGISLLWIQGESDALAGETTVNYEAKLRSVITRLRTSDARLSNLQFIMLKLSDLMTYSTMTAITRGNINQAFANIAADTTNTLVLNPDAITGITLRADNLHYTSDALLKIGTAWKNLIP